MRGEDVKLHVCVLTIDISVSHSSCNLIYLLNGSHQKDVQKLSKINQNFVEWQR